ncbi:Uncharacterised protein [Mycobacteroides abscessus subsp. abscessus]|nr:Uncharacterised protein [Mycobacteroides abscessus subsp. abscessus]
MGALQRIADGHRRGIDIDIATGQQLTNLCDAHTVSVLQPALPRLLVHLDDLLRDPVDVVERDRRHHVENVQAQSRIEFRGPDLLEHLFQYRLVAEPVRPHQDVCRDVALRQPACMLERGRRGMQQVDRDSVPGRGEERIDVRRDRIGQDLLELLFVAQLADIRHQQFRDRARDVGEPSVQSHADSGHRLRQRVTRAGAVCATGHVNCLFSRPPPNRSSSSARLSPKDDSYRIFRRGAAQQAHSEGPPISVRGYRRP